MIGWRLGLAALCTAVMTLPALAEPDFWSVTGVPEGDVLNIRKLPSADAAQVGAIGNGDRVQNLGCEQHHGSRWCKIRLLDEMGGVGWVNARYLTEASGPSNEAGAVNHGSIIKNRCAEAVANEAGVGADDVVVTRATISEGTGRHVVYVGVPNAASDWICEATDDGRVVSVSDGG